jgi:hypothetical protein
MNTPNVKNNIQEAVTKVVREYSYFDIDEKYCVFKVEEVQVYTGKNINCFDEETIIKKDSIISNHQGVCTIVDFNKCMTEGGIPSALRLNIFSGSHLDLFAKYGFNAFDEHLWSNKNNIEFLGEGLFNVNETMNDLKINDYKALPELIYDDYHSHDNIYDILLDHPELSHSLYFRNTSNHRITDLNGEYIPIGIHFDYCSGNIDNESYDLEKLSEWIKNRGGVIVMAATRRCPNLDPDNFILDVPYYNNEDGNRKYMDIIIEPTNDEFNLISNMIKESKEYISLHDCIKKSDCFGLEKFSID